MDTLRPPLPPPPPDPLRVLVCSLNRRGTRGLFFDFILTEGGSGGLVVVSKLAIGLWDQDSQALGVEFGKGGEEVEGHVDILVSGLVELHVRKPSEDVAKDGE